MLKIDFPDQFASVPLPFWPCFQASYQFGFPRVRFRDLCFRGLADVFVVFPWDHFRDSILLPFCFRFASVMLVKRHGLEIQFP